MDVSPIQPHVKAANIPLERLAANPNISDSEKVGQACRQFEAVFLREIFKEARKTVISSSLNKNSAISDTYGDMINSQLADSISRSGQFGLAKSLQNQLVHQVLPQADTAKSNASPSATRPHSHTNHKS